MSHETVSWNVVRSDSLRCIILNRKHVLETMSYIRCYNEVYHKTVPSPIPTRILSGRDISLLSLPPSYPLPLCKTISNNTKYFTAASFYIFTINNFTLLCCFFTANFLTISRAKLWAIFVNVPTIQNKAQGSCYRCNQCLLLLIAALGNITKYGQIGLTFGSAILLIRKLTNSKRIATYGWIHFYLIISLISVRSRSWQWHQLDAGFKFMLI